VFLNQAYNTVDANLNYQSYAHLACPAWAQARLADDLVIAPYATALALMVAPEKACLNLQRLSAEGFESPRYGFMKLSTNTTSRQLRRESSQRWYGH